MGFSKEDIAALDEEFRAKERARLSVPVQTNIATLDLMTQEQERRLRILVDGYAKRLAKVIVHTGASLSLPDGWVSVALHFEDDYGPIYAGISPEGDCHT